MINNKKMIEKLKINIALSNFEEEINSKENPNECTLKNKKFWRLYEMKKRIAVILTSIILMSGIAFAYTNELFSGINGDELLLSAIYEGDGIVSIYIKNESEKTLEFQNDIKLIRWSDNKEIKSNLNKIKIDNTVFKSKSSGTMKLDISEVYDIDELEKPLNDDHYFFILTNNNFIFGHDWYCSIDFSTNIKKDEDDKIKYVDKIELDDSLQKDNVKSELASFFKDYIIDPQKRNEKIENYYQKVTELLSLEKENGKNIITTIDPNLFVGKPNSNVVFDSKVSKELQYQLVSENHSQIDAFNIPVGACEFDNCMILSAIVPQKQRNSNTTDGTRIPLIYIFQYDTKDFQKPNTYVFIRGNLYTYDELEKYKVYEDDKCVSYNVTDLFYSDLEIYINMYIKDRGDIYTDEGVYTRIRNIYNYYQDKENLSKDFYYHK